MSTPAWRNSKLDGLAVYAPRRVCAGLSVKASLPRAPAIDQAVAEQLDRLPGDADAISATRSAFDEASAAAVEPVRDPAPAAHTPRLPRAANLPPPELSTVERPPVSTTWPQRVSLYAPPDTGFEPANAPPSIVIQRGIELRMLARVALVVGAAAIAAYGLVLGWSDLPQRIESAHTAPPPIAAAALEDTMVAQGHLIAENRRAFANEPLTLGALVDRTSPGESVLLAGLQAGTRLSAGVPLDPSHWQLPSKLMPDAVVYAPKDFVGLMNTAVNLLSPQGRLIDSEAVELEWIPKKHANEPQPARPASLADAANRGPDPAVAMDPEQALIVMMQGEDLLKIGDIAAARLAFRRLADAGNADAALRLAMTYEPRYLAAHGVIGIAGDEAAARMWYERAKELGSAKANRILAQTFSK